MHLFGEYIRTQRKDQRMSLRQLAERIGVNFTYLSKIENGELPPPSEEKIAALAEHLHLEPDYLFQLAEKPPEELARLAVEPQMPTILRAAKHLNEDERREVIDFIERHRLRRAKS